MAYRSKVVILKSLLMVLSVILVNFQFWLLDDFDPVNTDGNRNGAIGRELKKFSRLASTFPQKKTVLPSTSLSDDMEGFAACVLTMDDNVFWPEWLAYHYETLPLRRLIVAIDPKSQTTPKELFERYEKHHLPINITVWENDEFMDPYRWRKTMMHQNKKGDREKYIRRQSWFYQHCLRQFHLENRSWVALVDTDEFVVPSLRHANLVDETVYHRFTKNASQLFHNHILRRPWMDAIDAGCILMTRRRFIPNIRNESSSREKVRLVDSTTNGTAPNSENGAHNLLRTSYLNTVAQDTWYQQPNYKVMLDMSRFSRNVTDLLFLDQLDVWNFTPHEGISDACKRFRRSTKYHRPYWVHHYGATLEQIYARAADPRISTRITKFYAEQNHSSKYKFHHEALPFAKRWVNKLYADLSPDVAWDLLRPISA